MTMTSDRDLEEWDDELERAEVRRPPSGAPAAAVTGRPAGESVSSAQVVKLAALWSLVVLAGSVLVVYAVEPLFQQRAQASLLERYRTSVYQAAQEAQGLPGIEVPTKAPEPGAPVAVLEIGRMQLQQVVVEGVTPSQTQAGPGHVPGTAGPGQPGNSVIVGRRGAFGGTFGQIAELQHGDKILVTTTQGQSVYLVDSVRDQTVTDEPAATDAPAVASSSGGEAPPPADPATADHLGADTLFGPTPQDRLTLVTSASASPLNASSATVVRATLQGAPFAPTPQGGRTTSQTGLAGDASAWPSVVLALLALVAAGVGAALLYRRSSPRVAYLLTTGPLLLAVVLFAESGSRLLPAWM